MEEKELMAKLAELETRVVVLTDLFNKVAPVVLAISLQNEEILKCLKPAPEK
jgi:hypothetical protein